MGVIAQWQSADGLGQRPWVQLPVALPFFHVLCHFEGLRTVMAQIVSFIIDTITIGLWTIEETCPSDFSTAVIMLMIPRIIKY